MTRRPKSSATPIGISRRRARIDDRSECTLSRVRIRNVSVANYQGSGYTGDHMEDPTWCKARAFQVSELWHPRQGELGVHKLRTLSRLADKMQGIDPRSSRQSERRGSDDNGKGENSVFRIRTSRRLRGARRAHGSLHELTEGRAEGRVGRLEVVFSAGRIAECAQR